jgi:hypothetical protein
VTARRVVDLPASVFARLKNLAQKNRVDVQFLLTRYFIERFLYRLEHSAERDNFILKGAMLFTVWTGHLYRPSKDLDLLGRGPDDVQPTIARIRNVCATEVPIDDGVTFGLDDIEGEEIRSADEYHGVRIHVNANLGQRRARIQIDIGVGDPAPGAHDGEYPTLLDLPAPNIRMYSREAVVAEKFEAIVSLGAGNSRMKDFADLWVLQRRFAFDGTSLVDAIAQTFARRSTPLPDQTPVGLTTEWAGSANQEKMWRAFVKRTALDEPVGSFADLVDRLRDFLMPVAASARISESFPGQWRADGRTWTSRG